ncbi:MAG TPA: glycosyltransferase family 1 protein [Pyrinomonadaceae bacterium]|nr:glycosyltransferase family 1 protein [Pyrinomonadaceae bacterium]
MAPEPFSLRIGVVDQTATGWVAAAVYSRTILRSLDAACNSAGIELFFLSGVNDQVPANQRAKHMRLTSLDYLPAERQLRKLFGIKEKSRALRGEARLRKLLRLRGDSDLFGLAQHNSINVLLPLLDLPPWRIVPSTIGWIPDFQHLHLPQFFGDVDLRKRDMTYRRLAEKATVVMLSSHAAHDDFATFVPEHADKGRVVPFPSLLAFEDLSEDPVTTRNKFNLPEKFALVANQFWAHKNHALVVEALAKLQTTGVRLPVVMTGLPSDHRDPANKNFSTLLQSIASAGLNDQITILGLVPYGDLVNLMRTAALIIQPSRFEGWSTVVQDAVALGRPLLCSNIAVHREQVPGALGFFPTDRADVLAELLEAHWNDLQPGPDYALEQQSLAAEREFSMRHGQSLLKLCAETAEL